MPAGKCGKGDIVRRASLSLVHPAPHPVAHIPSTPLMRHNVKAAREPVKRPIKGKWDHNGSLSLQHHPLAIHRPSMKEVSRACLKLTGATS